MEPTPTSPPNKNKLNLSIDLRIIVIVLLVVIAAMLAFWRPWQAPDSSDRTISVTGDATLRSAPDEFQFNPSYQFRNADKTAAINEASAKQKELTAGLKAAGVSDSQIKSDVSGYEDYTYETGGARRSGDYIYTLSLVVTVPNQAAAQKVEDYLATTSPQGAVTPYPAFSESMRKKLESQARDMATKDARSKADQSAKNLGFKVTSVKSVDDGSGFGGGVMPFSVRGSAAAEDAKVQSAPVVQPGENELAYSVTVVYFIR